MGGVKGGVPGSRRGGPKSVPLISEEKVEQNSERDRESSMYLNECLTDPSFKQGARDKHHQQCAPTCFIECSSEEYAIGTFQLSYVFNLENRYVRVVVKSKKNQFISLLKRAPKEARDGVDAAH